MLANNALTTLEKAKSYLGIDPLDTTKDDDITFLINSASSLIEKKCRRVFGKALHIDNLPGRGATRLVLEHYPILELMELHIFDQKVDITKVKVLSDKGMLYRANGGFPGAMDGGRFMHPKPDVPYDTIYVEYWAGYVLPKDDTPAEPRTLPFDLELACLKMIAHMNRDSNIQQGNGNMLIKSESIGDWSATYEQEVKTDASSLTNYFSKDILDVLSLYERSEYFV